MGDTAAALALGVGGAIGLYLLWRQFSAPPVTLAPAPSPGLPTDIRGILTTAILNPNAIQHAAGLPGTDGFRTFGQKTAAMQLGQAMCSCYHGNAAACLTVKQQSPTVRCKSGDCDCHITDTAGQDIGTRDVQTIRYRDSRGTYTAPVGRKTPAGGCRTNVTAAEVVGVGFPAANAAALASQINNAGAANIRDGFCN